jgi:hypothetical protein
MDIIEAAEIIEKIIEEPFKLIFEYRKGNDSLCRLSYDVKGIPDFLGDTWESLILELKQKKNYVESNAYAGPDCSGRLVRKGDFETKTIPIIDHDTRLEAEERQVGAISVTFNELAELLGLPKDHKILHVVSSDPIRNFSVIDIAVEGNTMPKRIGESGPLQIRTLKGSF